MLAELYNNFSGAEVELLRWSFHNQDEHNKIVQALFLSPQNLAAINYILDPMPDLRSPEIKNWSYRHQAAHTAFNDALGLSGSDLTNVDWSQRDQVESWIYLHAREHVFAQQALGYPD